MMNIRIPILSALLALLTFTSYGGTTQGTPILRLPCTITKPGVYVLKKSLTTALTTGAAITIQADHVTIDLNDHSITLVPPSGFTGTISTGGINCAGNDFVRIRNGVIAGFATGVAMNNSNSEGIVVEDLHVRASTNFGMLINGFGAKIRHCSVTDTACAGEAFGLVVQGDFNEVTECTVLRTSSQNGSLAHCLEVGGFGDVVRNNLVGNLGPATNTLGVQAGQALVVGNTVVNMQTGFSVNSGSKLLNNLTTNCATAFNGGTQVTGNN